MIRKFIMAAIVGSSVAVAACGMVKGAAGDVNSVANCTEELIKQGQC
jgi:predicted small secreted protein